MGEVANISQSLEGSAMNWPSGWHAIEPGIGLGFEAELARELSTGHPLYGVLLRAVGQCGNGDDILFEIADGSRRVVVVHLTWGGQAQQPPCPDSVVYESHALWLAFEEESE